MRRRFCKGELSTFPQGAKERTPINDETPALPDSDVWWAIALVEEAEPYLLGPEPPERAGWLTRLESEYDDLRAILVWCVTRYDAGTYGEPGLRLAGALWRFWDLRTSVAEGRSLLDRAIRYADEQAQPHDDTQAKSWLSAKAKALYGAGYLAKQDGDLLTARTLYEASLALRRTLNDRAGMARSLHALAGVAEKMGDRDVPQSAFEECIALWRELGDGRETAGALTNLAIFLARTGDYEDMTIVRPMFEECLAIYRALRDRENIASALSNMANALSRVGDAAMAQSYLQESLTIYRDLGNKKGIASCLDKQSVFAFDASEVEPSVLLFAAAGALWNLPEPTEAVRRNSLMARTRKLLSEAVFAEIWEKGRTAPWEKMVAYALGEVSSV